MEIRTSCEHCDKALPNGAADAMICTFDCTFCKTCVDTILENVCPNCGGGLVHRPTRPSYHMEKHPVRADKVFKPINMDTFVPIRERLKSVPPNER